MSVYNDVREALGSAIQAFQPDVIVYYYVPRSITPPAAIIQPNPNQTINYLEAQSSRSALWYFNVMLVLGLVDEEAAQQMMGEMVSPGSALLSALNTRIATGYSKVTAAAVSERTFDNALYTYARLSVTVTV